MVDDLNIEARAAQCYDQLARPIRTASLFYALYILTEQMDETTTATDLQLLTNQSYDAFRTYAVYSVVREMHNANHAFSLPGGVKAHEVEREVIHRFVRQAWPERDADRLTDLFRDFSLASGVADVSEAREMMSGAAELVTVLRMGEREWDAVSDPEQFMADAAAVFDAEGETLEVHEAFESAMEGTGHYGWPSNYGGPAWAGICRHYLRADDLTKIAWVNQSWSVQHNNAVWLDKLTAPQEHRRKVTELWDDLTGQQRTVFSSTNVYRTVLPRLLRKRKRDAFGEVFYWATAWTEELTVNLRRLARRHGIEIPEPFEARPVEIEMTNRQYEAAWSALSAFRRMVDLDYENRFEQQEGHLLTTKDQRLDMLVELEAAVRGGRDPDEGPDEMTTLGGYGDTQLTAPLAETWAAVLRDYRRIVRGSIGNVSVPHNRFPHAPDRDDLTTLALAEDAIQHALNFSTEEEPPAAEDVIPKAPKVHIPKPTDEEREREDDPRRGDGGGPGAWYMGP